MQDDFKPAPELIAKGRALFKGGTNFILSAPALKFLPDSTLPEVAFAGRSNVGKSTIINAITDQKGLAKTSNTPGRTQQLNYFNVGEALYLVDMPGYGYAEAPKAVVDGWHKLIKSYLRGRPTLHRVYLLIDSRHGIKNTDAEIMALLDECGMSYRCVLTKQDKISVAAVQRQVDELTKQIKKHPAAFPIPIITSSKSNLGLDELRADIAQFV